MNLFLDTEFNGFTGALISMALVPDDRTIPPFYEVLECLDPCEWVAIHVMPIIGKGPISRGLFQNRLERFLMNYRDVTIIADWHEDIAHFCNMLTTAPGQRIETPSLRFVIDRYNLGNVAPTMPHNALSDALAMQLSFAGSSK